jgi:hypothetical protein
MRDLKTRLAGRVLLLFASVLSLAVPTFGQDIKPPKAAPWNIQSVRQKYYSSLDAARQDAVRQIEAEGLTLSYNTNGTVVRDEVFEKAARIYNQKQQSLLKEVRSNGRREQEFQALSQSAGARIKREGGAQPGDEAYSGALSDRDVELNTKAQVESLTEEARKQGYHVVSGPGYVKILELDTVVWEPFRSHGPAGVELRHDDPEVMLSYEVIVGKQKASVTQQVKKIEELYREEIPNSTQKQHELVASLAKAVAKSADAIGQSDLTEDGLLDRERLEQYQLLKSRKLTKDDLISPFDRPEAQEQQLKEIRKKAGQDVRTCDATQAEQRQQKIDRLKAEQAALSKRLEQEQNYGKRQQLMIEISDAADLVNAIERDLSVDEKTRRAINRKNPKLATAMGWNPKPDSVIPDRAGDLARISRVIDEAVEISKQQEPRDTSATEAFDAVADANRTVDKVLNSPLFKIFARVIRIPPSAIKSAEMVGKGAKAADENFFSPTQGAIHSEGFVHATGDGMKEYIARRLKEEAAQGWDITDPELQGRIHLKAIARATALGTYEGAKHLPGLGDVIQGYENTFLLTESSVGLVYDTWKSQQTVDMNRFQQEGQLERAIQQAKASRDLLRRQMDIAAKAIEYSKEIEKRLPSLYAEIEQLQQQINDRRTQLESLTVRGGQTSPSDSPIDPQTLSGLRARMETLTRLSKRFTADCEKAIARVKSGKVPHDELLEVRGRLQRQLMDEIDGEYIRIETLLDQVNARILMVTAPDELVKTYDALLVDYGQSLVLASSAEELAGRLERSELLYKDSLRCYTEEKKRILEACDYFSQRAVGDENLRRRLSQMRGEMTDFRIANYQLQQNGNRAWTLKREATWLRRAAETPGKPPRITEVSPGLRAECEQLQQLANTWKQPEAAMTAAVEEARAKFRELQALLPLDPPAFSITADQLKPQVWEFTVESVRVPEDATLNFSWDFGDGTGAGGPESKRQHQYAKPGEYTVNVRVYLERENHSEDLGEVSTQITLGDPLPKPQGKPASIKPFAGQLMVSTTKIELDGELKQPPGGLTLGAIPAGQYYADGKLTIGMAEDGETLSGQYFVGLRLKLERDPKIMSGLKGLFPPYWHLDVNGTAHGSLNQKTGDLHLAGDQATWTENVSQGVDRNAGGAEARQRLQVSPDQLDWTGEITGSIDWRNFGGGQGRFKINPLIRGTWTVEPRTPYLVPAPTNSALNSRLPEVRLFPSEAEAIQAFVTVSRNSQFNARRTNIDGFGDQAIWSQNGMLIRLGRWHIDYSRCFFHGPPESYRTSITAIQQYLQEGNFEAKFPVLSDP